MKSKTVKTQVQERALLRASEQRKLEHAVNVLLELLLKHMVEAPREREIADLHRLKATLLMLIKNQHISDKAYAEYKGERFNAGDF